MEIIKESKLIELLRGINPAEYKRLGDFVMSPFHNKSENQIKLYEYLKNYSQDFSKCAITNEDISRYVYRDKKLNAGKVRSMVSDFVRLIEQFFVFSQFETYDTFKKVLLLNELNNRDQPKNFRSVLQETMKKQLVSFNKDEDFYYNQIFLEVESFNYNLDRHPVISELDFQKIGENIDLFFILTKLNLFHFKFYHRQDIDEASTYNLWLLNEIQMYIENHLEMISKQHPVIYIKYLVYMTIIKPEEENYFYTLKKYALSNAAKFDSVNMAYIFSALTNFCTLKCNLGIKKFKMERFNIYKMLDDRKILDKDKFMNYVDFLNTIISAAEVNKVVWAEYFYNKNKNRIMPAILKEDTLNMAKAQILYIQKNYDEALKLISVVSYNNQYFYLRSKMILSRIYYDKNEIEPIIYIIDAAKHYLKRNKKITKMNREAFGNFYYFMTKILKLLEHTNPQVKETKQELIKQNNVSSKEWLLNKLTEMEGS